MAITENFSEAGDFIAHELSVAVHDQNVDMASAVRAAEAAAERQAAAAERRAEGGTPGLGAFMGSKKSCYLVNYHRPG